MLALLAAALVLLVGLAEVVLLLTRHVMQDHPEARLLLGLTAVMLPYAVLICLAAQVTAILQSLEEFAWPAAVPVVLNVFWIGSVFVVDPWFEPDRVAQAYALAVCVVVAGRCNLACKSHRYRDSVFVGPGIGRDVEARCGASPRHGPRRARIVDHPTHDGDG